MEQQILALLGPTAVGKTNLSIQIARELNAEIISADSRQIYKQLDIGTAKPGADLLSSIKHHFIDELELTEHFSAGRFAEAASLRIEDIRSRGRTPLVVGGSTLYLAALLHGMAPIPPINPGIRYDLKVKLERAGAAALFEELMTVDPESARTMDATKSQRIVRALEVYYGTGKPISSYHASENDSRFAFVPLVLIRNRDELYTRIDERVDLMFEAGWVHEVESILNSGADPDLPSLKTIGYREVIDYLRGYIGMKEAVRLIKRDTRRYAKRQITWFRRFPTYKWIQMDASLGLVDECFSHLQ